MNVSFTVYSLQARFLLVLNVYYGMSAQARLTHVSIGVLLAYGTRRCKSGLERAQPRERALIPSITHGC